MTPHCLKLLNFVSHENTELDFEEIRAACIQGPNGAGKSTLIDAILYALYGQTSRGKDDNLVMLGTDEMTVIFDFEHSGKIYRIIRKKTKSGRGKNITEIYLKDSNSGLELIATGDAAKEKILRIINMDFNALTSSSFLLQGQGEKFIMAKPSERLKVVSDILGLDKFDEYKKVISLENSRSEGRRKAIEENTAVLKEQAGKVVSLVAAREEKTKELELAAGLIKQKDKTLSKYLPEAAVIENRFKEIESLENDAKLLEKEKSDLAAKISAPAADAKTVSENIQLRADSILKEYQSIGKGLKDAIAEEAAVKTKTEGIKGIENEISALEERTAVLSASIEETKKNADTYKKILDNKTKIQEYVELEKNKAEKLLNCKNELEKTRKETASLNTGIQKASEIEKEIAALEKADELKEKERTLNLKTAEEKLSGARKNISLLEGTVCKGEGQYAACPLIKNAVDMKKLIPDLEKEIAELKKPVELNVKAINGLKAQLVSLGDPKKKLEDTAKIEAELKNSIAALEKELLTISTWTGQASKIDIADAELKRAAGQIESIEKDKKAVADKIKSLTEQKKALLLLLCDIEAYQIVIAKFQAEEDSKETLSKIAALDKEIAKIKEKTRGFEEMKNRKALIEKEVLSLKSEIDMLRTREKDLLAETAKADAEIKSCQEAEAKINTSLQEIASIEKTAKINDALIEAYEKIPYYILDNVLSIMEEESNKILEEISSTGMRIELRTEKITKTSKNIKDTLDIIVSDISGERPIEMYSGGEKTRQALALAVGMAELSARRAGERIDTILFDEPSGLDKQGQMDFAKCLVRLVDKGIFKKAFMMAHEPALLDAFEQKIIVSKEGDRSRVEVHA